MSQQGCVDLKPGCQIIYCNLFIQHLVRLDNRPGWIGSLNTWEQDDYETSPDQRVIWIIDRLDGGRSCIISPGKDIQTFPGHDAV